MSTTGRGRHSVLWIFKGRRGHTGYHATCGALPAAGPYLRLSRLQGIVHHLSGPDRYAHSNPSQKIKTPWSVFQDGSNGEPTGQHREHAVAEARLMARADRHDRGDSIPRAYQLPGLWPPTRSMLVHTPSRSADQLSLFHIRPGRIAGPHSLPSRQFQALFDSLFRVLFIFPSRYLFSIGLSPVFSLGWNLPPDWGCITKQPDSPIAPRGAIGSEHDGALTLSGAPFQGTWARSAVVDASPDYNSNDVVARFSCWAILGSLAITKGILRLASLGVKAVTLGYDNDPSAGSPTETLLRLLLPLNDKVQWTSRYAAGSEPPTSERSEHFTRTIQLVGATGGVYKGQGRSQRELMTRAY
ncbi:hypothetical protein F511_30254 [Dorcoceras hygrometricum]|uniref:Uncharacterized protein n=1 Tax=Dorcoceras hygrometricum TaxID=472368 RepID=A0A2Z7DFG6_9LAMI|nr:hypothetical protein F511_30254 [Dorcoceras hygrometricum]